MDPQLHARRLLDDLSAHRSPPPGEVPGFDTRLLLKLTVEGLQPDALASIPGLSVVSQEKKDVTVFFATEGALHDFQDRLRRVATDGAATRQDILFAVRRFDYVSPEDRTGTALRTEGCPATGKFRVDVEFWPLELSIERDEALRAFRSFSQLRNIRILDEVNNAAVLIARVETSKEAIDDLLRMRDVRLVDLPPRYQLESKLLSFDIGSLAPIPSPPANAPGIVILDSGLATNHPLLAPAIGDSESFTDREEPTAAGLAHGTMVASIALYGDLEPGVVERSFEPELRIFGARVWDEGIDDADGLIENRITRAVTYFRENYGCRIFVLAFGDQRKPYGGGHLDRLAGTIDTIAREQGVLFVVSAGNFLGTESLPESWRTGFPSYLLSDEARILDPAPALNALTVGSIARYEVSNQTTRSPDDPAHQPIARANEPSPFTRSGPGPLTSIKPELVEFGGNRYVDTRVRGGQLSPGRELGEVGASSSFGQGPLFARDIGTSFSAPKVAHIAARILNENPSASPNLVRALIVAHAEIPEAARNCLDGHEGDLRRLVGYGRPRQQLSSLSSQRCVTMFAEERIGPDQHHFYELPLPDDLFSDPKRRRRRISVAIAHSPRVRRSRIEYRQCALSFRVVRASSFDRVEQAYRRLKAGEDEPSIPESAFSPKPTARAGGTVQCATHYHEQITDSLRKKPYFVVVTHSVPAWSADPQDEPYAIVAVIEDMSDVEVQLYSQIRQILRARVRPRVRT